MSEVHRLKDNLARLNKIRTMPTSDAAIQELRQALKSKSNHVVVRAAEIIAELGLDQLHNEMASTFERLLDRPVKTDPGCNAKTAIAEALWRSGYAQEGLFLRGAHCIQLEPVYGGKEDTAARLRVICAMALVQMNYPQVMNALADLLADPELDARIGAVRAITFSGQAAGIPLLRFKAHIGDKDPRVRYECFQALLKLDPQGSVALIATYLDHGEEAVCEAALIALGESKQHEAVTILIDWWQRTLNPALRRIGLTALAVSRDQEAIEFLLSLVAQAPKKVATETLEALKIYQDDRRLWRRLEQLIRDRGDLQIN